MSVLPALRPPAFRGGLRSIALPMALLALVIVALTAGGIAYTVAHHRDAEQARIQAIADLKSRQIADWLQEREGDLRFVQTSRIFAENYRRWREEGDAAAAFRLKNRLDEFRRFKSFQGVLLYDEAGVLLWNPEGRDPAIAPELAGALRRAASEGRTSRVGPYRDSADRLHLDFLAPLSAGRSGPSPVVVLHVDPEAYLFRLLRTWPVPSPSGEALLFRRDADRVLFLNTVRHRPDAAAKLRVPVAEERLLAARVLRGEAGLGSVVEGVDYRGVPVVGFVRAVPGTDWFLVAKLDAAEIRAEAVGDVVRITLVGLLALLVTISGAYALRQRQSLSAAQQEREAQAEKLRALSLLDAIAEGSDDAIFAKDAEGRYLLCNGAASRVVGKPAGKVLGQDDREIFPPAEAEMLMTIDRRVMADDRTESNEETLTTAAGIRIFSATKGPIHDASGRAIGVFGISRDVTERKLAEQEREVTVEFLALINESLTLRDLIAGSAAFFQRHSGCEAVGIRLKEGDDYPYYEAHGFPHEFVVLENSLCERAAAGQPVRDTAGYPVMECMCGNVICGRTDPGKPFFTRGGSFWSNCTTELLATTTDADRQTRTRNRCNGAGYESVALIPLTSGGERLGLLQLNDRRENRFTAEGIARWERLAGYLAVAIAKIRADEELRRSEKRTERLAQLYHVLSDTNKIIIRAGDEDTLFRQACDIALQLGGFRLAWVGIHDPERGCLVPRAAAGELRDSLFGLELPLDAEAPAGRSLAAEAFRRDEVLECNDYGADRDRAYWHAQPITRGVASAICLPLHRGGRQVGVLSIGARDPGFFDMQVRQLLEEMARDISFGLENLAHGRELRASEMKFRSYIEHAPVGIFVSDGDGRLLEFNQAGLELLGLGAGELAGLGLPDIVPPEDLAVAVRDFVTLKRRGYLESETQMRQRGGSPIWVALRAVKLADGRLMAFCQDITERKRAEAALRELNADLERRVAARTAALEAANRELESFTYSVSHDLRAPLRAIQGFSRILLEDSSPMLDETGREHLNRVCASVDRMERLIEDLLGLSRVSRTNVLRVTVDLSAIARGLAEELRQADPRREVDFAIAGGVRVLGDAGLLRIMLQNLLGNAWKFTGKKPRARIEFGVSKSGAGETTCFVRDDGAGFDVAYADQLFGVFKRLHPESEFAGTGIGLATVRRIVTRHGGRIWAEAAPEGGATFFFTLAAAPPED